MGRKARFFPAVLKYWSSSNGENSSFCNWLKRQKVWQLLCISPEPVERWISFQLSSNVGNNNILPDAFCTMTSRSTKYEERPGTNLRDFDFWTEWKKKHVTFHQFLFPLSISIEKAFYANAMLKIKRERGRRPSDTCAHSKPRLACSIPRHLSEGT